MSRFLQVAFCVALLAGCNDTKSTTPPPKPGDEVKSNLDKLSADDRALAEQQKVCPATNAPLGSMGVPIKVMVKDQPVFICCKACEKGVLKDPDATLKKVEELKAK
jgi:hypothetical protein